MNVTEFKLIYNGIINHVRKAEPDIEIKDICFMIDYINKDGKVSNNIILTNITYPCEFPGCFKADCFSQFRYDIGFDDKEAITSNRTFSIKGVRSMMLH